MDTQGPVGSRGAGAERRVRVGLVALALAFLALVWVVSHHHRVFGSEAPWAHPIATSGDEPHYLVVLNSLLFDGDLNLHDDYRRVSRGGFEAGVYFRGAPLNAHTIFVDHASGKFAYAHDVYDWRAPVSCGPHCFEFRRAYTEFARKPEPLVEVPIHPPAYPALLAAFIAPLRPELPQVEAFASSVVALWVWLAVVITYVVARNAKLTRRQALASCALVGLASPLLAYANSFYAEPAIGLALIGALWAFRSARSSLAALLLILAAAMKPPFALVGAAWIAERMWAKERRGLVGFGALLAAGGVAILGFNYALARKWMTIGPGFDWADDYLATFLDTRNGLLAFVPWSVLAFVGLAGSFERASGGRSELLRQTLWPTLLFGLLLAVKGGPGSSYGPRFWVPCMPFLALAAVAVSDRLGRPALVVLVVLGLVAGAFAIPGALGYPVLFNKPPLAAWTGP